MKSPPATARNSGMVYCHVCQIVCEIPRRSQGDLLCPRCGEVLHLRRRNSLSRTSALVVAALIFYVPAMRLPIMVTTSLGQRQSDTIITGVKHFIQDGNWFVALVIFIASILIPLMKLLILAILLITVKIRSSWLPRERTRWYRFIQIIGRWSMVDIYVVTILVALVKLGNFADVDAGPAAVYFAAVVIITIFATESFDPRLIWDALENSDDVK